MSDHSHHHPTAIAGGHEKSLWIALGLTTAFLIAELIGAWLTHSLALFSDAAHMFTDVAALAIALAAMRMGKRAADVRRTYGYYRFEILAAAFNATALFVVALFILWEAIQRFWHPPEIHSIGMLTIALLGLMVNLIAMRLLRAGREASLNLKSAYLEVWSDMLGSIGVILAAIVIYFTGWKPIDPFIAIAIALWVLPRTWTLLKDSLNILLEGVPTHVDMTQLEAEIRSTPGVVGVHDLHVWAVSSDKVILTAHIVRDIVVSIPDNELLKALQERLIARFHIHHTTLQLEHVACTSTVCQLTDVAARH